MEFDEKTFRICVCTFIPKQLDHADTSSILAVAVTLMRTEQRTHYK
jgi:hypothetical protein